MTAPTDTPLKDDSDAHDEGPQPGPGLGLDEPPQPARETGTSADGAEQPYRVLARKYRPVTFDGLIGQEPLVRTLTNAIEAGRIAQAFMLTGVRGVGKTTTARIIAKALNCIGSDGSGSPTVRPCGICQHCTSIAEDRHVDVIEMDAASRTGVDDIRELIDGVRYRPVSARYKVYVLDEVHMLSKNAFNALLKTLEEPPEHVKFVFATTEIRKVPVTVLSRCQRFDLRRVPMDQLTVHFRGVADSEGIVIEDDAVAMIARAADGSVRDGLSILDQAIALSAGTVTAERVRDMLGLADRTRVYDLLDAMLKGDAVSALDLLAELYTTGAEPAVILEDLLDVTHFLTRALLVPDILNDPTTPELERTRGRDMVSRMTVPVLSRIWQMLLKGLGETRAAPSPIQATEMAVIRLLHVADMPPPGELAAKLREGGSGLGVSGGGDGGGSDAGPAARLSAAVIQGGGVAHSVAATPEPAAGVIAAHAELPKTFSEIVALFDRKRHGILATHLRRDVHLVRVEPGRLEFRPGRYAPPDLHGQIGARLSDWTGERWVVSISNEAGDATLAEQQAQAEQERRNRAESDPLVQAVKSTFPGAQITRVSGAAVPVVDAADPELPDDPDSENTD